MVSPTSKGSHQASGTTRSSSNTTQQKSNSKSSTSTKGSKKNLPAKKSSLKDPEALTGKESEQAALTTLKTSSKTQDHPGSEIPTSFGTGQDSQGTKTSRSHGSNHPHGGKTHGSPTVSTDLSAAADSATARTSKNSSNSGASRRSKKKNVLSDSTAPDSPNLSPIDNKNDGSSGSSDEVNKGNSTLPVSRHQDPSCAQEYSRRSTDGTRTLYDPNATSQSPRQGSHVVTSDRDSQAPLRNLEKEDRSVNESGLSLLDETNGTGYTYDKDLPKSTIKSGFGPARRDGGRFSYLRSKMSPRGSVIPGSVQKAFKNTGKALTNFSQFVNNISPTPKNQSTGDTIEFESNILTDTFDSNVDDAGPTTPHHNNLSQQEHTTPLFPETATIIGSPKRKKAPNGDIEYLLSSIGSASGADDSVLSAIEKVWRAAGIVSHLQLQQPLPLQLYQTIDTVLDEAFPELHMRGEVLTPHHNRYSHQIRYMAKLALQEATKMMMLLDDTMTGASVRLEVHM